ncbi:MAG: ribosome biogenesis GTPase Der [Chthoniobacteraceae bacterium]
MPGRRTIAIVGRPNVGKSALFNRLAQKKISIVHDMPGVTRDRISSVCRLGQHPFEIIDTGGIGGDVDASFTDQVHAEVEIALTSSELLLFVVDGQDGITPVDLELAKRLRKADKPLILVVNKIDHDKHSNAPSEFSRLGFQTLVAISAEHNRGIGDLIHEIEKRLPPPDATKPATSPVDPVKIAIVGRPNVGKSSLTNAILKDDRTLVSPISGTTRDAIDVPYERHGNHYVLIDTAGIRARGKVDNSVEVFSIMRSEGSIKRSDLCLLVIDATAGVTSQDKKIAGLIQAAKRPCVVALNKWDLIKDQTGDKEALKAVLEKMKSELFFIDYAPVMLVSAKTGAELTRLFRTIERVRIESTARISTGVLNRLFEEIVTQHPPPLSGSRRLKILFATQPENTSREIIPLPEFVLFVNDDKCLDATYKRFIEARLREKSPFTGVPIQFRLRGREKRGENKSGKGISRKSWAHHKK